MEHDQRPPARESGIFEQCGKQDELWRVMHYELEGTHLMRLCDACFRERISPAMYHALRASRADQGES